MDNGIKPTRLWYLTGRKHFKLMVNKRLSLTPPNEDPRKDFFKVVAIILPSVLGLAYSYGVFSPARGCLREKENIVEKTEAPTTGPPLPCPAVKPPKRALKCPSCTD